MSVMKKSSVFAAMLLGLFVASAHAETIMKVRVPFPFVVKGKVLPAGRYEVSTLYGVAGVIMLKAQGDVRATAMVFTNPAGGFDPAGGQPALVFKPVEHQETLLQVWASNREGSAVAGAKTSAKAARADNLSVPETWAVLIGTR
jgi:hypothetical protein